MRRTNRKNEVRLSCLGANRRKRTKMVLLPALAPPIVARTYWWVAVHGLTDLERPIHQLTLYLPALCPWPFTTPLFFISSVAHFARDIGVFGSGMLHAVLAGAFCTGRNQMAYTLALSYLSLVHVPLHYAEHQKSAPWLSLLGLALAIFGPTPPPFLMHWQQRLVTCHVALTAADTTSCSTIPFLAPIVVC